MITGFSTYAGEPSATYDTAAYEPGIPAELIEIGHSMALEDYAWFGPVAPGYDSVRVTEH